MDDQMSWYEQEPRISVSLDEFWLEETNQQEDDEDFDEDQLDQGQERARILEVQGKPRVNILQVKVGMLAAVVC